MPSELMLILQDIKELEERISKSPVSKDTKEVAKQLTKMMRQEVKYEKRTLRF